MKKTIIQKTLSCLIIAASFFSCAEKKEAKEDAVVENAVVVDSTALRPNIIFIMVDDLGYGDLENYGQKEIKTPNLLELAKNGIQFSNCYSGSPVCAPARSTLMTGKHTGHTTVRGNTGARGKADAAGKIRVPILQEDVTVAEVLKSAGYSTGMTGKWGLGEPNSTGLPNDHGFDEWFGFLNQDRAHHHFTDYIWRNKEKYEIAPEDKLKEENYTHNLFTQFSLDYITENAQKDNPFFLYIPYLLPHDEYEIPQINPLYEDKDWTDNEKVYASMITLIDSDVGKIVAKLKELNISENTLLFFTSDNGPANRWDGTFDSAGKLKGFKRDVYEGGTRAPMIVSMPGTVPQGVTNNTPWYFPDVFPTLADLAGVSAPADLDGISVKDVIINNADGDQERVMYWEFHKNGGTQAIRKGKWKLVRVDVDKKGFHDEAELYDLSTDEAETTNVADQNPELVQELIALMNAEHIPSQDFPFKFQREDKKEDKK